LSIPFLQVINIVEPIGSFFFAPTSIAADMHTFTITPRPDGAGKGWTLKLLEDGEEAGGGAFPIDVSDPQKGIEWWKALGEKERALWLDEAKSTQPADAWHAWLAAQAYENAHAEAMDWINSRSPGTREASWPGHIL